ncbi:hypothetical protein SNEBB_010365 [Seison nebaliae]|nr:hypothetical protein SNEBB_010365 [Seison nebaliae]
MNTWMTLGRIDKKFSISSECDMKKKVIFVLGGPGAGKGTQCSKIENHFNIRHLSAGELLRQEMKRESDVGEVISRHIAEGSIVPVEITCRLLQEAMEKDEKHNKFLIDGFPRNRDNYDGWRRYVGDKIDVLAVLFFEADDKVCVNRIMNRAKTSGRTDDNEDSLKQRLVTYHQSTMPIIRQYETLNLVKAINANKTPDEVWCTVSSIIQTLINLPTSSIGGQVDSIKSTATTS